MTQSAKPGSGGRDAGDVVLAPPPVSHGKFRKLVGSSMELATIVQVALVDPIALDDSGLVLDVSAADGTHLRLALDRTATRQLREALSVGRK